MLNQKISVLPRKYALSENDILPIVDSQFGPSNYVNKKTTVGDLMDLARTVVNTQVSALSPVSSVNGESGVVVLSINQLDNVGIAVPASNQFLVYDGAENDWVNKDINNVDFVLDCGSF